MVFCITICYNTNINKSKSEVFYMKIEKINDNQIKCTLNKSDLASRQIKISELAYGTEKAKSLFRDMMQQASYEFGFEAEDIPLMIEAIPISTDCIVLVITKVEDPEELDTRFSKFTASDEEVDFSFNPENSPESKYYNLELEKKKAELTMYKRQRYPNFKFYASYALFGQNPTQYFSAINNVSPTNITVGLSGTFAIFDGFKNRATCEKAALELKKIQLQKEQKLNEIKMEYERTYAAYDSYTQELALKKMLLNRVQEKLTSVDRMNKSGLIEKNEMLSTKADLLTQEFDLQKNIINISSKIKEIQIRTGRDI